MCRPRVCSVPDYVSSAGLEAVELAEMAGLRLDPWQASVLESALGERSDGKWAAFEVGLVAPRQNGKDAILEARELAGLFLLGERMIIHSAHQFDTSLEHFRRLLFLIESTPDLDRRVMRVSRSHGEEGIELRGGQRIRFRTRTKGGGRGFTGDLLLLNEAMIYSEAAHGALLPTLSARPNPQVWYAGSPVDQLIHDDGVVFARVRERGIRGDDPSLAFFEWSVDDRGEDGKLVTPDRVSDELAADPSAWAQANPGLGIRISEEHIERELLSMDARTFAVERLGIGDWPVTDGDLSSVIDLAKWRALTDEESRVVDPVCFAFDVTPARSSSAISVGGFRSDRLSHVEVVEHRRGTGWVVGRLGELCERHSPSAIVCDGASPAASLVQELEDRVGVQVRLVNAKEHANACGLLFDLVEQEGLRHLGSSELVAALKGAARRPLGDAWAWSRKSSSVDISPLVSSTLALWGSRLSAGSVDGWAGWGAAA